MEEGGGEPLVRYQAVIRLEFTKDIALMTPAELLKAARELRVLRFIRSTDVRNPVYRRLVAMEQALAALYYLEVEPPPKGWKLGDVFDQNVLFASREDYLQLFDEFQTRVDSTPTEVLPEEFIVSTERSTPRVGVEEHERMGRKQTNG